MEKNIIDSIEDLKHRTYSSIKNIQISNIPSLYKLKLERRYIYNTHGFRHPLFSENSLCYVCSNIPFTYNQTRHEFTDTLDNLVKSQEVYPFLLFLNHEFIKWSNILIVKDCNYSYIIILEHNYNDEVQNKECILIPQYVNYVEKSNTINDNTIFAFDTETNKHIHSIDMDDDNTCTRIDLVNTDEIYYVENKIDVINKLFKPDIDPDQYKLCRENIIMFNNGYLCDSYFKLKILPLNMMKVENKNNVKKIDLYCKIFFFKKSNKLISNIDNLIDKNNLAEKMTKVNKIIKGIKKLDHKFDFTYNRDIDYEKNVYNSLKYIMEYNSSLMDSIYKNKSNIISRLYKGKDLLSKMDDKGYVTMSRRIDSDTSTHVIIFKNDELYNGYSELKYINKNFKFPIIDISEEDKIEIMYFKNVSNKSIRIFLDSLGDDLYTLDPDIDMENMKLFTTNTETHEFNIVRSEDIQYEIGYTFEKCKDKIKIIPNDSFYYDKVLSLASKRQFRYFSFIAKDHCIDTTLPEYFKFCNEKDKYLVFINGRKIDNNNFKITLFKNTRPFDDLSVYMNIILEKGDKLEIFYVPENLEEIVVYPNITTSGSIIVDKTNIQYNLNKDLYLIFINGKRVTNDQIINIDQNKNKIITDTGTVNNLTIIKHIKDEEILSSLFNTTTDEITKVMNELKESDIDNLYPSANINNIEDSIYDDKKVLSMKTVLNKIIKDYYFRPYINTGEEFVYDFDEDGLDKDEEGNIILDIMNANIEFEE